MNEARKQLTATRLEALAGYIEANVPQTNLDMRFFRFPDFVYDDGKDCGTVHCALGHAPQVEGCETVPEDHADKTTDRHFEGDLIYAKYFERLFGVPLLERQAEPYSPNERTATTVGAIYSRLYNRAFSANLSSDKPSVVRRLREAAHEAVHSDLLEPQDPDNPVEVI